MQLNIEVNSQSFEQVFITVVSLLGNLYKLIRNGKSTSATIQSYWPDTSVALPGLQLHMATSTLN
jgi:hypothetical protein